MPFISAGKTYRVMPSPFSLIGKCLQKVRTEQNTVVLVAPLWQNQTWYPVLLELMVEFPLLLPDWKDILRDPMDQLHWYVSTG